VLPRDQTDPGRKFPAGFEYRRISNRGRYRSGGDRSDTRDRRQATADDIRLVRSHECPFQSRNALLKTVQFCD
jgi:hypothetical protein